MTELTPITLDDNTVIYMETKEDISLTPETPVKGEVTRGGLAKGITGNSQPIAQNFQAIEGTIKAYTNYTLNAFKEVASANIDKVTLEFGIKVGGKAGIPYVTQGSTNCHLKVTVECSFPEKNT